MNGYYISIKNDLLEKKHMDAMGSSVWLYMWLIDKVTSINEDGIGKVLGGKPIKQTDFEDSLQLSRATYFRYIKTLEENGYISTIRTPYGLSISVQKAKKQFANNGKKRVIKNEYSVSKNEYSRLKNEYSNNKTIQLDNTIRQTNGLNNSASRYKTAAELGMPDLSTI